MDSGALFNFGSSWRRLPCAQPSRRSCLQITTWHARQQHGTATVIWMDKMRKKGEHALLVYQRWQQDAWLKRKVAHLLLLCGCCKNTYTNSCEELM